MDETTRAAIERLKQNKDLAAQLMRSGDGQALLRRLTQNDGGAALDAAARSAAAGDTAALAQMLRGLMQSPDGAALLARLNDAAKK